MSESLNLTEENRADLRALVSALTADIPQPEAKPAPTYDAWAEIAAVTRKAFINKMVTQVYKSSPLISELIKNQADAHSALHLKSIAEQEARIALEQMKAMEAQIRKEQKVAKKYR